jgi:anti-sigma factor RsiW
MTHLNTETIQRYADGEMGDAGAIEQHLRDCAACANAVVAEMQLKRAVREAARMMPPDVVRARVRRRLFGTPHTLAWAAAAAVTAFVVGGLLTAGKVGALTSARELADLHATILSSANPVDVISTDRHTVKPWFEGKLPFSFNLPELAGTPFRILGGRVVYAHGQPVAYVMIGKGGHKLSLFVAQVTLPARGMRGFESVSWRSGGLTYVLVGDVPRGDLEQLRNLWSAPAMPAL